jgi:hypothetical protein
LAGQLGVQTPPVQATLPPAGVVHAVQPAPQLLGSVSLAQVPVARHAC